jgi:Mg-chelatase subunit ChlI
MSQYSDPQHALLHRIARALEDHNAITLQDLAQLRIAKALERIADTLDGHSAETKYFKDSKEINHAHHRTIVGEIAGIKEIIQRK